MSTAADFRNGVGADDRLPRPADVPEAGVPSRLLGIDVGGTTMKAAFYPVLADGRLGPADHPSRRPTPPDETAADAVLDFARNLLAEHGSVDAVGLALPGIVDDDAGIAEFSVAPTWADLPLRDSASKLLGLPVAVGHDVRLGGFAEGRIGAAVGSRDFLFVALGTGIGGMACLDGARRLGPHHRAIEVGHVVVDRDGEQCGCGQRGCLESIASATGIARLYGQSGVSAYDVARRAAAGDTRAVEVWRTAVDALATVLLATVTVLDLDLIVVGGGVAKAGEQLLAPLRAELAARATFQHVPRIVRAALGDEAAVAGAALLALDAVTASATRDAVPDQSTTAAQGTFADPDTTTGQGSTVAIQGTARAGKSEQPHRKDGIA